LAKKDDSKIFAFLGVFLTIIGFLIVLLTRKEDKYAMYYAKQGLVLFIAFVVVQLLGWVAVVGLFVVPLIAGLIGLVLWILYVVLVVLWVLGIVNAFSGKEKPIPIIGKFADKINL
jgi:uncharacterized membrane protein